MEMEVSSSYNQKSNQSNSKGVISKKYKQIQHTQIALLHNFEGIW